METIGEFNSQQNFDLNVQVKFLPYYPMLKNHVALKIFDLNDRPHFFLLLNV